MAPAVACIRVVLWLLGVVIAIIAPPVVGRIWEVVVDDPAGCRMLVGLSGALLAGLIGRILGGIKFNGMVVSGPGGSMWR